MPLLTGQMAQVVTAATFEVWALAQSREDGHRSLVTPERVLSEYNEVVFLCHCYQYNSFHDRVGVFTVLTKLAVDICKDIFFCQEKD